MKTKKPELVTSQLLRAIREYQNRETDEMVKCFLDYTEAEQKTIYAFLLQCCLLEKREDGAPLSVFGLQYKLLAPMVHFYKDAVKRVVDYIEKAGEGKVKQ